MGWTFILILAVAALLMIASVKKPTYAVVLYLVFYILYNPNSWWASIFSSAGRPSLIAVAIALASCLLHAKKLNWEFSRRELELFCFLALAWVISVFLMVADDESWQYLCKLTKILFFVAILLRVVKSLRDYRMIVWTLILAGVFLIFQAYIDPSYYSDGRLDSLGGSDFSESNQFGSFLVACIILLGFEMLRLEWWKKSACVVMIALMLNGVIMTQSRAVIVGLVPATIFAVARVPSSYRKQAYLFIMLGMLAFASLMSLQFMERLGMAWGIVEDQGISSYLKNPEAQETSRVDIWKAAVLMVRDNPFGVGVKNFENLIRRYKENIQDLDAHSTYVLCIAEIGFPGLLIFITILLEALFQVNRVRKSGGISAHATEISLQGTAIMTVLIFYFTGQMLTHSILYSEILWILLAFPICFENAVKNQLIEEADEKTVC